MFATTERVARLFGRPRASACCRAVDDAAPRPRAMCEELEGRQLMSAASVVGSLIPANVISPALAEHKALKHVNAAATTNVLPITITNIAAQGDQLVATGNIAGHAFTAPVTLDLGDEAAPAGAAAVACLEPAAFFAPLAEPAVENGDIEEAMQPEDEPCPRRGLHRAVVVDDDAVARVDA